MMIRNKVLLVGASLTATLLLGCNSHSSSPSSGAQGVGERTGLAVDKALATTRDTVKDGVGKAAAFAEKTGDKIKDGVGTVGDKVKGGVEKVGDVFEKVGEKVKDATR